MRSSSVLSALAATALVAAAITGGSAEAHAAAAGDTGFTAVDIPARADIVVHQVTIALVAPQGTTPSFDAAEARRSVELVDQFYARETGGAIRFQLERVIDWQAVDEPIDCSNTGGLHDWIKRKTGWQPGPARHLVAMVPPGPPCPNWANGEQRGDPDDGGLTFQGGPDAYLLAHELGHNLSLPHAFSVQCATTWDYSPTSGACPRLEYGNRTDVMGTSWAFLPLSAPSLARLGTLSDTRSPVCGAPRTTRLKTLGAGPGTQRALRWADPQDSSVVYWVQYNDRADATSDGGAYTSPSRAVRSVSGVQVLRSNPIQPYGGDLLERPGDGSEANEFALAGETVTLNSGMSVRVDAIDEVAREATVTVTVPCTEYTGDITRFAVTSASTSSPWAGSQGAVDGNPSTYWGTWPSAGTQTLELRWPQNVTVDRIASQFAADAADSQNQGLIPSRSWRAESYDAASGTWRPITDTTPTTATRTRDTLNAIAFPAVTTDRIRLVYEAWGSRDYAGSTGVSAVEVRGVAPVESLVASRTAATMTAGSTSDIVRSVDVMDRTGQKLAGRRVAFDITGPATFANGARTASAVSGATGSAVMPQVTAQSTPGPVAITASVDGRRTSLAPLTVVATSAVPAPAPAPSPSPSPSPSTGSGSTSASVALVDGRAVLKVRARNATAGSATISIVTPYGRTTVVGVAAGATVEKAFSTGRKTVKNGVATVTTITRSARTTTSVPFAGL
ncbi:hypothetical protein C5B94_02995 [Clavibacter michiganensis]|uniref:discoidin domain-containing protein n=1 Tax=Clavibacter michiganensis TaxID=28447 RepID=UPI000CE7E261|nr:discoidin domain-containing protein [Clavibacter michiganensis]PPF56406.1 hypothetical protein C5B94_02995 [Clavibacter michiganensis]